MTTKNGVPFRRMMVSSSKWNTKCPYPMNAKKITIHNTDNQMPAKNEVKYMIGNNNATGFHVGIDEKEAIQGIEYFRNAFHAGDGARGYGNRNTIGIEICRNYDRTRKTTNLKEPLKSQFDQAVVNTIKFVAQLCIDQGIVPSHDTIKKHQDWSGKYCPSKILRDGTWNALVAAIVAEYNRLKGKPVHATVEKTKPPVSVSKPSKPSIAQGESIVDYLNKKGRDSSFAARKKLADQYGIKGYRGTAEQNTALLNKLKSGAKPVSKPKPKPQPSYKGDSIVDYLNRQGKDSSFSARKKLAAQYGIRNYTGTAAQNIQLLDKVQSDSKTKSKKINTDSIVDYLNITGQPSDFASRKKLAAKHGIKNYTGTASQNKKLLDILNK